MKFHLLAHPEIFFVCDTTKPILIKLPIDDIVNVVALGKNHSKPQKEDVIVTEFGNMLIAGVFYVAGEPNYYLAGLGETYENLRLKYGRLTNQ